MSAKKIDGIRKFGTLKVLVLGDVMLDIYDFCYSASSRPSPEKPGKRVYTAARSIKTLGGAGNVAANLATLGVTTSLIGMSGDDGHHFTMCALADARGLDRVLIRDPSRPTTTKTRLYIDDEYVLRRDDEEDRKAGIELQTGIIEAFLERLDHLDAVILSDYNKGFFTAESAQKVIQSCGRKGIPVVVDFKPANRELFSGAEVIAPNEAEARALQPGFDPDGDLEAEMAGLYRLLQCRNLVVTLGGRGLCGFTGTQFFRLPANPVKVVDAVGCGDTVRVGLALGCALGFTLRESVDLANDTAAVVLQKIGTATVSADELLAFIRAKP